MDSTRLRTMTYKSRFDGGKYTNQTVETILSLDKGYLIYEYFRMSKITFIDEILNKLGISEAFMISKPGVSDEKYHAFQLDQIKQMDEVDRIKHFIDKKKKRIKDAKDLRQRHINDERRIFSKQSLKNMNAGYMKLNLTYRSSNGKPFTKNGN